MPRLSSIFSFRQQEALQNPVQSKNYNGAAPRVSLPDEVPAPVDRSHIAIVIITALVAVLGVNAVISISGGVDRLDGGGRLIREKWTILDSLDQPVDWLILGDSSAVEGVIPDQLEASLGGSAVNLATVANMLAIDDVWMLDEYIGRHGAPKNVVIVHVYDVWHRNVEASAFAKVPLTPGFWWSRTPSLSLTLSESVELLAFRYLPLYQSKELVKRLAADPSKLLIPPRTIQTDGFTGVDDAQPANVEYDFITHTNFLAEQPYELSDANRQALNRLVELTDKHGFNVYIANSPIFDGLKADQDFQSYFANVQNLLIELDDRSPNIHYVLCDTPSFSKEIMTYVDHVTLEGAKSFTAQLAQSISMASTCENRQQ